MRDDVVIERYLVELERRLWFVRPARRRRICEEARDHLLEAAEVDGAEAALARFGDPASVASGYRDAAATGAARLAVVALGAGGLAYGAIQALLSPAVLEVFPGGPWPNDVPPAYLAWKVNVAGALVAVAALLGFAALVFAWRGRGRADGDRRRVAALAAAGAGAFLASWPFETVFMVQRGNNVAGSPAGWVVALVCTALLACHVAAALAAVRATRLAYRSA